MRTQGRRESHWIEPGNMAPVHGKRVLRTNTGRMRMKFCLRMLGIALFVACPYTYLLLMRVCAGHPMEPLVLVLFPVLVEAVAVFIHKKGT